MTGFQSSKWRKFHGFRQSAGRGVRRQPGQMNGWEKRYAARLDQELRQGLIQWYAFDAIKLRLADTCFYTPDFIVMTANADMEFHEVKGGYFTDDAKVKLKVASALFPFRFKLCVLKNVSLPWEITVLGQDDEVSRPDASGLF